ncbi:MAG: MFS transporter [Arachnia sp.]
MTDDVPSLVQLAGRSYFPVALIARLPFAMLVVGMLTLVVGERDSLTLGGLTSAAAGIGTAVFGPLIGSAADRWGQRRVLLAAAIASSLAMASLAWVAAAAAPEPALLAIAFVVGATAPQVAPMSRSRLVGIIGHGIPAQRRASTLTGTMAYESAADEVVFVFGPVMVGILATTLTPAAPVIGAAGLTLIFVTWFALHPSAQLVDTPSDQPRRAAPIAELFRPGVLIVVGGMLGIGLFFGSTLTWLTSFMADRGVSEQAGLIYGAMGISSAIFALAGAWFSPRFTSSARWVWFSSVMFLGSLALWLADSILGVTVVLFVIGIGIGPTLVTLYHLAALRSPLGRSATVMTMLGSGVVLGQAFAAAVTGWVAQNLGTSAALAGIGISAGIVAGSGLLNLLLDRAGTRRR